MDNYAILLNLLKYKETKNKTPLENFTTELFIFLLSYLIYNKSKYANMLLKVFGFNENIDFNNISITSQYRTKVGKKEVIPDILIKYKNKNIIIEVKVDAELNEYELENEIINQIELYNKIENITDVYLITKKLINIKDNSKRIFWTRIYSILESSNDFVVKSFLYYLEENGMKPRKINKDLFKALNSLSSLFSLVQDTWNFENYSISPFRYSTDGWFGCYVKRNDTNILWMGIDDGDNRESLYVHIDKGYSKNINLSNITLEDGYIFEKINLVEIINKENYEKQKETLLKWFKKVINKIEKNKI